jgi:predicted nucleotidyltransferase
MPASDVRERFEAAVEAFVERAKADRQVLAAILFGSLTYDVIWDKSDVDLILVTAEPPSGAARFSAEGVALVERDVNLHAMVLGRSEFRKMVDGSLRGGFVHSMLRFGRVLFSRDPSLTELVERAGELGARDRRTQLFRAGATVVGSLYKAEKFLQLKGDPYLAYLWLARAYTPLAEIEIFSHGGIPSREALQQALVLHPSFFGRVYTDLLADGVNAARVADALAAVDEYLTARIDLLYRPLLDWLAAEGVERSATDIDDWAHRTLDVPCAVAACEWLADKQVLTKLSAPLRLTIRSQTTFEELAFYYGGE